MCDPPRMFPPSHINPLFNNFVCANLPECTHPSQNIPPLSTNLFVRPSQNVPLPPRLYPLFNNMRPSQNLPLPPRIYPLVNNYNYQSINQSIYSIRCSTSFWYTQKTIIYKVRYIAYDIYIIYIDTY